MCTLLGGWQFCTARPDDGPGALEDSVRTFAEEGHPVLGIHEGEVHRQIVEEAQELLEGEGAAGKLHRLGRGELEGVLDQLRRRGLVVRAGHRQAPAVVGALVEDLAPLLVGEEAQGHGEEDVLLFVDHALQGRQGGFEHGLLEDLQLGAREGLLPQGLGRGLQELAHLVVLAPHDLAGATGAVPFQDAEDQLLLAAVVLLDVHDRLEGGQGIQALGPGRHLVRQGGEAGDPQPGGLEGGGQGLVLALELLDGVPRGQGLGGPGLREHVLQDIRVKVAHGAHFFVGHARRP